MNERVITYIKNNNIPEFCKCVNADNVNTPLYSGYTVLHYACMDLRLKMIEKCIELGANVNARTDNGTTILYFVIASSTRLFYYEKLNLVKTLLRAGSIPDGACLRNCLANDRGSEQIKLLIDYGARLEPRENGACDWIISIRDQGRRKCLLFMGLRRFRSVLRNQDMNVLRMVAKQIWAWRMVEEN